MFNHSITNNYKHPFKAALSAMDQDFVNSLPEVSRINYYGFLDNKLSQEIRDTLAICSAIAGEEECLRTIFDDEKFF